MRTAWEPCPNCRASGHQDGMYGIVTCYYCRGDCMVRIRDDKGRFATKEVTW